MKVKSEVAQSCPTLRDAMDCSLPVHGISQARVLEWVAIALSEAKEAQRADFLRNNHMDTVCIYII